MKIAKAKVLTLIFLGTLLIINSLLLFSYYNFYLSDKISSDLITIRNQNNNNLYFIINKIKNKDIIETEDEVRKYVNENGGYVSLKDRYGNILYTNKKDMNKLFSSTIYIIIDNDEYELTYSKLSITPGMKVIRNFMVFEIVLLTVTIVTFFILNSRQLINPIELTIKDINDYKYGKIPVKRKMPKQVEQIQNTFVDMVDKLEIEKEYQNQIIASISHDIKTPLTSVIGYTDRLKNSKLDEEKKVKYIDKIYNQALLMKSILEEFDDYQSCNLKKTLKYKVMDIKTIKENLIRDYEEELKDKRITFKVISNCDDKKVKIDEVKIKRVFSNIITNSVTHFKSKEGIINVVINYRAGKVKIEVADNGGGIEDEKNLKKIFEPLYTSDPSRKISGLGLSICKQIIIAHDGCIYAKNNSIKGLSIIFIIPSC